MTYITTTGDLAELLKGMDPDLPVRLDGKPLSDWRGGWQGRDKILDLYSLERPVQAYDAGGTEEFLRKAKLCDHQTGYGLPWLEYCGNPLPCKEHKEA